MLAHSRVSDGWGMRPWVTCTPSQEEGGRGGDMLNSARLLLWIQSGSFRVGHPRSIYLIQEISHQVKIP